MQIKKSTLKLILISLAIVVTVVAITVPIYYKHRKEEQRAKEFVEYIEKTIEREYKDLLRDYDYYVKEALDSWNSRSSKERAIRKINHLLGQHFFGYAHEDSDYIDVVCFESQYKEKNNEAKSILREKAREKAMERLLE